MKKQERVEFRRLGAVADHLRQYDGLLASNFAAQRALTDLVSLLDQIDGVLALQMKGTKSITASKNAKRVTLIREMLTLTGQLGNVAVRLQDDGLLVEVSRTPSWIKALPDEDLGQLGKVILETARSRALDLEEEKVFASHIDGYEATLDIFLEAVGSPRLVIITRKTATSSLPRLLKQGRHLLRQRLGRILLQYELDEPTFYRGYVEATKLNHVAVSHGEAVAAPEPVAARTSAPPKGGNSVGVPGLLSAEFLQRSAGGLILNNPLSENGGEGQVEKTAFNPALEGGGAG